MYADYYNYNDEFFDDLDDDVEYGFCGFCEMELGVHYHCTQCEEVTSMLGHYDFASDTFKCEPAE